ncbi:MAG: type I-U CRISPR-associated protein Cas8c [Myxococcota bacterium]
MMHSLVPVDLFNPGQVFACIGLLELCDVLLGGARGGFDWSEPGRTRFHLTTTGGHDPLATALRFLADAEVYAEAPAGTEESLSTEKWDVATRASSTGPGPAYPIAVPPSPATLVGVLKRDSIRIRIDHWGDTTRRDNVKFWAGSGGYPGVALLRDALDLARPALLDGTEDPFEVSGVMSSSFRFDWRRDYVPLDTGFSLNNQSHVVPRATPVVEVLAGIRQTRGHSDPIGETSCSTSTPPCRVTRCRSTCFVRASAVPRPPLPEADLPAPSSTGPAKRVRPAASPMSSRRPEP